VIFCAFIILAFDLPIANLRCVRYMLHIKYHLRSAGFVALKMNAAVASGDVLSHRHVSCNLL